MAFLPCHTVDGFTICERETGQAADLLALQPETQSIMVKYQHRLDAAGGESTQVCSGPITDWVIEYSVAPCIWVCTAVAWYKLARPAAEYAPTFAGAQRRLDLCTRVAAVLAATPCASLEQALPHILSTQTNAPGMSQLHGESGGSKGEQAGGYAVNDLRAEAGFVCAQLRTLLKRQNRGPPALYPLLAELLDMGMPEEYGSSDDSEVEGMDCAEDSNVNAGLSVAQKDQRRAWRNERAALEREARAASKRVDLERGNPPPPCLNFRLSHDMVPELVMVWEMIMAFSHLLQLPPISLESLEAAIMPGPMPKARRPHPPVAAPPAGLVASNDEDEATIGLGGPTGAADEVEFAGPGNTPRADWADAGRRPPGEEEWGGHVQYDVSTLLDVHAGPSALVLRDVHSALIKMIDGFSPKILPDPPERARLAAEDNKSETWQECTWKAILDSKAPQELIQAGAKDAAELLKSTAEYTCLQPRQRLLILRSLLELALNSEVMRDYALQKAELISGALPVGVSFDLLPADPSDDVAELRAANNRGSKGAPTLSPWEAASPDAWVCWLQGCRVGVRRPLGTDFRKRRYWALGGRAGCWRVFVEAPLGGGWGWYEGSGLQSLLGWLRAGQGIEVEAPLLRALQAMPLPMKWSEDPVPPYPVPLPSPPVGAPPPTIPWTSEDLRARRPDGYKLLAAPMLRGEYHQVLPSYGKVLSTQERTLNCCQALLSELNFEDRSKPWASRIARVLCGFEARSATSQAEGVLEVEAMLHEAGLLAPVWSATQLQGVWRRSLARPNLNFRDVAMHLHALQRFCRPPTPATNPTRYHFMRHITHLRCPVSFPCLYEPLVCLRTGCMANLDKFLDKHPKLDYPSSEVVAARQSIAALPPVQHVKIVCLGYRNYPGPNYLAQPQDNYLPFKAENGGGVQGGAIGVQAEGECPCRETVPMADGIKDENPIWPESRRPTSIPGSSHKCLSVGEIPQDQGAATHAPPHQHRTPSSQQGPLPQGSGRPPAMWMVLQRMRQEGDGWVPEEGKDPVVMPIHVDASLPEFVLRPAVLEAALTKPWQPGTKVRFHHPGAKAGAKAGGAWIKGTVHHNTLLDQQPGGAAHDPWGSIHVVWDLKDGGTHGKVNPWELEADPDELRRQEDERKRAEEAAARAQRAEAKSRRQGSMRQLREEYADFGSDDLSSGPNEGDEDSDDSYGGRKKKNQKKPTRGANRNHQHHQQQAALQQQQQQQHSLQRHAAVPATTPLQASVVNQFRQCRDQFQQYAHAYQRLQQSGQGHTQPAQQYLQAAQQLQVLLTSTQAQVSQVYGQHGPTMVKQLLAENTPRSQPAASAAMASSVLTPAQQQQQLLQRQQQLAQQQQHTWTQQQQQQQQLAHTARLAAQQRQIQMMRLQQQQQQQQQQQAMYPQAGIVSQRLVSQGLMSQGMVPQQQGFVPQGMVPQSQGLVSQPQSTVLPPQGIVPHAPTMLTPTQLLALQQQQRRQQQQLAAQQIAQQSVAASQPLGMIPQAPSMITPSQLTPTQLTPAQLFAMQQQQAAQRGGL